MNELIYFRPDEYNSLMKRYHTVASLMEECQRGRSWAYNMIASCPSSVVLHNMRTGKRERAVPRTFVSRYMARVKRGNPYW